MTFKSWTKTPSQRKILSTSFCIDLITQYHLFCSYSNHIQWNIFFFFQTSKLLKEKQHSILSLEAANHQNLSLRFWDYCPVQSRITKLTCPMFLSLLYIIKLSHLRLSHPALMPFCCCVLSHPMLSHHSRDNIYPVLSDPVTISVPYCPVPWLYLPHTHYYPVPLL